MEYEIIPDQSGNGDWRVEWFDETDAGAMSVVIFSGARARELAEAYVGWLRSTGT